MKNVILITLLSVVFTIQSCTQKSDNVKVLEKILTSFKSKFPDAIKIKWEMENETEWEADFELNGQKYSANFNSNGEWVETEFEIKPSEIPIVIRSILDQNFTDYEIEKAEISETASGKSYEFEVEVGEEEFELAIDSKGKLTKKKKSEENEEKDGD